MHPGKALMGPSQTTEIGANRSAVFRGVLFEKKYNQVLFHIVRLQYPRVLPGHGPVALRTDAFSVLAESTTDLHNFSSLVLFHLALIRNFASILRGKSSDQGSSHLSHISRRRVVLLKMPFLWCVSPSGPSQTEALESKVKSSN